MKKKGFTLIETAIAFAIFLIALIPLNQMTRNVTRMMYREVQNVVRSIGADGGYIQTDDEFFNNMLDDLRQQAEWGGYNFFNGKIGTGSTWTRTYNFKRASGNNDASGCATGEYFLNFGSGNGNKPLIDYINMDAFQTNNGSNAVLNCYPASVVSAYVTTPLVMSVERGKIKNLRTIPTGNTQAIPATKTTNIDNQSFIYGTFKFKQLEKDFVITPFQERCLGFTSD